jgi:hypothetical protein
MSRRAKYEMPAGLKEAQERFDQWRNSQTGRRPIPEPLWVLASELARQHGVFRTAQALRLDYTTLKRRSAGSASTGRPKLAAQPAFVELISSSSAHSCECIIEVEGPRGRMRVEWKGSTAPDLAGLSRALWEPVA